jgi:hypothetical protein
MISNDANLRPPRRPTHEYINSYVTICRKYVAWIRLLMLASPLEAGPVTYSELNGISFSSSEIKRPLRYACLLIVVIFPYEFGNNCCARNTEKLTNIGGHFNRTFRFCQPLILIKDILLNSNFIL